MICLLLAITLSAPPNGTVLSEGVEITPEEMIQTLAEADVVFLGEKHDDALAHEWEFYIWEALSTRGMALALEMFETDVQTEVNRYLAGETSIEEFLAGTRPWSNYETDYAPLVELAKERGCSVIAANVPRNFAAAVARGGFQAIENEEFFQNIVIDSSSVLYRDMFMATMEELGSQMHGMPVDFSNMYRAQLLKDAVMAESIAGVRCLFICGSFHSDYHSGIPDQLDSETACITISVLPEGQEPQDDLADFLIVR